MLLWLLLAPGGSSQGWEGYQGWPEWEAEGGGLDFDQSMVELLQGCGTLVTLTVVAEEGKEGATTLPESHVCHCWC